LVLVSAAGGLAAGCGVKGPLYLPPETKTEMEKKKDADKTSQRPAAPAQPALG
jgi:predicted small lipoprotein YifL